MKNSDKMPLLSIGQVSKRCGVKPSTLHFYEDIGLIKSWRNSGNQRRYKKDVLRRVSLIKAGQKVGVELKSIKVALDKLPNSRIPDKADWEVMSKAWKIQLDEKIRYLEKLRNSLTGYIGCGCLSMSNCPIYNKADFLGNNHSGPALLDK